MVINAKYGKDRLMRGHWPAYLIRSEEFFTDALICVETIDRPSQNNLDQRLEGLGLGPTSVQQCSPHGRRRRQPARLILATSRAMHLNGSGENAGLDVG